MAAGGGIELRIGPEPERCLQAAEDAAERVIGLAAQGAQAGAAGIRQQIVIRQQLQPVAHWPAIANRQAVELAQGRRLCAGQLQAPVTRMALEQAQAERDKGVARLVGKKALVAAVVAFRV